MADLFTVSRIIAPRLRDPSARRARMLPEDRSILFAPEVQQAPEILVAGGESRFPPHRLRMVGAEEARARFTDYENPPGARPFLDKVEQLKLGLLRGDVPYRGRTVVEDRTGSILDGRALLYAIAQSGMEACCLWVSGVEPDALVVMDRHKKRHGGGIERANDAVAAARLSFDPSHRATYDRLAHRSHSAWVELTPARARAILSDLAAKGIAHRVTGPSEELRLDIGADRFLLTGQPIVFDTDNTLRDGARRCHAVVATGRSIHVLAVWGVDPGIPADAYDCTRPENLGYHLQRLRYSEGWDAQGSLRVLRMAEGIPNPTQILLFTLYRSWPDYDRSLKVSRLFENQLCQSIHVAARATLARSHSHEAADEFLSSVLVDSKDAVAVERFRRGRIKVMSSRQRRAARMVWDRIGTSLTSVRKADRTSVLRLFVHAFHVYRGERPPRRTTVPVTVAGRPRA